MLHWLVCVHCKSEIRSAFILCILVWCLVPNPSMIYKGSYCFTGDHYNHLSPIWPNVLFSNFMEGSEVFRACCLWFCPNSFQIPFRFFLYLSFWLLIQIAHWICQPVHHLTTTNERSCFLNAWIISYEVLAPLVLKWEKVLYFIL